MVNLKTAVINFAASKPEHEEYNYLSNETCPCAQVLRMNGYPYAWASTLHWFDKATYDPKARHEIPVDLRAALALRPWTYGELHRRLTNE